VPLTGQEKKVLTLIDQLKGDNQALLQRLVRIPSYSGAEAEIGRFLAREITSFGLDDVSIVEQVVDRPNVVARYRGKVGKPSITVYAHYDTVPIGDITQWHYGPLSGEVVGNRIYGRGVNDHKFPISSLLFAIKAIKESGLSLNGDIVFTFVGDEEFGGHRGMKYLVDEGLCDTDYLLYAVGGTDGRTIGIAANGRGYYRINVRGRTMHTGYNDRGVNAATKAAKLILRLEELRKEVNSRRLKFKTGDVEIEGKGRFSINLVHAFTTGNNVPDGCVVQIDRRLVPRCETFEGARAEIQAVIDELRKEDPEFEAELTWNPERWMNFAVSVPDAPLIGALQRSADKVLGFVPIVAKEAASGSSDHGWFNLKYPDRPFVSYGVSRGGNVHSYDEYATVDGLLDTTRVYALFLMDLLGVA
jgi:acetylornithine deacetylase/succinyl-diaminopimelate desuccinylase-like protein